MRPGSLREVSFGRSEAGNWGGGGGQASLFYFLRFDEDDSIML